MTIELNDIMIQRDGGTITFTVAGNDLAGQYRLRTPLQGQPRPVFRGERELQLGGRDEAALLASLREWFSATASPDQQRALARLDEMREWRDLSDDLDRAVPLHRIRDVIRCLEART